MSVVALNQPLSRLSWWDEAKTVALVRRTAAKDCDADEFNQFVTVSRELGLSPLRKQIYAFVFNKDNVAKRNMVLVVSIDGARAIAARHQNYRPDNRKPRFEMDETLKGPANPAGIVSVEVSTFSFVQGEWHEVVGVAYWNEFAPIKAEQEYRMVDTGEKWPDGNPKKKKVPVEGSPIVEKLDPSKDGWRKMPHLMIAKCAEMQALRKGWPEDLARVYVEEETAKASMTIDGEYTDLTPAEMVAQAEMDARVEKLGGPALLAALGDDGALVRVPHGRFADKMLAATENLPAEQVAIIVGRNKEALNDFWAYNKTDALALKKELEKRAAAKVQA